MFDADGSVSVIPARETTARVDPECPPVLSDGVFATTGVLRT